ncbi:hypothetical protein ACWGHM_38010 [Streptomyces sp. NPDC054904]|uniref:hypothetical protein n=1 Tax=Streptomyces sp. NPDC090054 TaxID=3365933 RepID=UPI0038160713
MRPSASVREGVRKGVPGAVSVLVAVVCAGGALTGCTGAGPEPRSTADAAPTPPPIVTRTPAPSTPPTPPTPPEGAEGFGPVVARDGDVSAHAAVREAGGVLRVPVSVTNRGSVRAFYEVTVRVTGPDGYEATGSFGTDTVGVYPGASWPTEVQVSMPGRAAPAEPKVEIARVEVDRH